jgi:hypothetical protein
MLLGGSEACPNAGLLLPPVALGEKAANAERKGLSATTRSFEFSNRLKM